MCIVATWCFSQKGVLPANKPGFLLAGNMTDCKRTSLLQGEALCLRKEVLASLRHASISPHNDF